MEDLTRPVYVVGHKNPDTDSICAAIAYARLKTKMTGGEYIACRAGNVNGETQFVLDHFGVEPPMLISDVRTQVRDIEIRRMESVNRDISLKTAWKLMSDAKVVTLPVTENDYLDGLITTGDIVGSYMDVYDSSILSLARTSYKNIVETLEGKMLVGDINDATDKGKVLIAVANPDVLEKHIEPGDVIILGNRYETQLCSIEMNAGCIIVCEGAEVSISIQNQAREHGCKIISTPHETFTVARLINQSLPIRYFMKTSDLVTFHLDDYIDDIKPVMAQLRHRYFPVLDENEVYVGMLSQRNFIGASKKQVILVDHNEKSQAVNGIESADLLEIIDHHRLGTVQTVGPVYFRNQPLGSTSTIVYIMYKEQGFDIDVSTAGLLCSAIISDTLLYRSPTCTDMDRMAGEDLAEIAGINPESYAQEMFRAGSNLSKRTPEQILHQDFKRFNAGKLTFAVGQITSMAADELEEIKGRIMSDLEKEPAAGGFDMVFFMLTNIVRESSEVLFAGDGAQNALESAFGKKSENGNSVTLEGVVSRKKQLLPNIVEALQQ